MKNFIERVVFVGIAVPLLFALILYVPHYNHAPIAAILFLFCGGSALELKRLLEPDTPARRSPLAAALGLAAPVAAYAAGLAFPGASLAYTWLAPAAAAAGLGFLLSAIPLAYPRQASSIESSARKAGFNVFYLVYPGIMASAIVALLGLSEASGQLLIWFALIVFGNDSLAWLAGVTLGRRRGIFAVSPNKSLEGLVAGLAGSLGFALAGPLIFPGAVTRDWLGLCALGLACGASVVTGDLFESALKRANGAKDSGSIVPGRGGILDSFDSLLFTGPVFMAVLALFGLAA